MQIECVQKPKPTGKGIARYKHGYSTTSLYGRWRRMIQRCSDSNSKDYIHYGGKGITVCDRWKESFVNFLNDMGEPQVGQSLDRIDNSKGYSPENCHWVTHSENMKNTCKSVVITFNGESKNLKDWAADIGIDQASMRYRIDHWPLEKALTAPKFINRERRV